MSLLKRGALMLLLAALLLPQSTASGQAPAAEPGLKSDTLVRGAPTADESARAAVASAPLASPTRSALDVSSVAFVQVDSPFMWGRTNAGGLSVTLTLEYGAGGVKGVASQIYNAAPNNKVNVDRTQLYFETVFVDPNDPRHPPVMIRPGDRVHIVTSDPAAIPPVSADQWVVVDDLKAWTSYERDVVEGTAPAGSSLVVTKATSLAVANYVTPGTGLTFAGTTAGGDGRFQVASFRTSSDATPKTLDLDRGDTGFVRLVHPDRNEVYTVHGQNVFVLERSKLVHGYAFRLPTAPSSLESNVTVSRPLPQVSVVHKDPVGAIKGTATVQPDIFNRYYPTVSSPIVGGDTVEVSINGATPVPVVASPLSGQLDLSANRITGSGPANTSLTVSAGRIDGYLSASSTFKYIDKRVTTNGSGGYDSGTFQCGSSNYLAMHPGSFGYVGFEDAHGSFVYRALAAPSYHVMLDYPHVEGWVSDGATGPTVTVSDSSGNIKHQGLTEPELLFLTGQKLWINTFFQVDTNAFIQAGDSVTFSHPDKSSTVPVFGLTAYLDSDSDSVTGQAPVGQIVRAIPADDRDTYREVSPGADGAYRATQPFTSVSSTSCGESTKTADYSPGDSGRVYANLADGNALFAAYGRSIHVNLNENYLDLYQFVSRGLDWSFPPARQATITLTPRSGPVVTRNVTADLGVPGRTRVTLTTVPGGDAINMHPGDSIRATFLEGLTQTRTVTIDFTLPLLTATPDVRTSTLAGVGPRGLNGHATLTGQGSPTAPPLSTAVRTAYPPIQFFKSGTAVPLATGYAGTASFTDVLGRRVWVAWAATADATAYPLSITNVPRPGDTLVCGTAVPLAQVEIHDATDVAATVLLGTGTADARGNFCVTVSPLERGQVLLAKSNGLYSQPFVVGGAFRVLLPNSLH